LVEKIQDQEEGKNPWGEEIISKEEEIKP